MPGQKVGLGTYIYINSPLGGGLVVVDQFDGKGLLHGGPWVCQDGRTIGTVILPVYRLLLLCNLVGDQNLAIRGGSKEGRIDIGMINFASANMLFGVTAKWRKKEWDETR